MICVCVSVSRGAAGRQFYFADFLRAAVLFSRGEREKESKVYPLVFFLFEDLADRARLFPYTERNTVIKIIITLEKITM